MLYAPFVADYVARSGVPFLSVDYRLAPQAQDTAPAQDVFAGLSWLRAHAEQLGVDPERVAVLGDSAGAGLAAGVAILAREQQVRLARQILIYPMLDDRTTSDPLLEPFLTISADFVKTGWRALLGHAQGSDEVSPVAAPGRLQDFTGLAPAYIEIGEVDLFRHESVSYAQRLWPPEGPPNCTSAQACHTASTTTPSGPRHRSGHGRPCGGVARSVEALPALGLLGPLRPSHQTTGQAHRCARPCNCDACAHPVVPIDPSAMRVPDRCAIRHKIMSRTVAFAEPQGSPSASDANAAAQSDAGGGHVGTYKCPTPGSVRAVP